MIRVQFKKFSHLDEAPTWLDPSVRAVSAAPFAAVDEGQGGISAGTSSTRRWSPPWGRSRRAPRSTSRART